MGGNKYNVGMTAKLQFRDILEDMFFLSLLQLTNTFPPFLLFLSPTRNEAIFRTVTGAFDKVLNPSLLVGVLDIPHGIVIDLEFVRNIDLTGTFNAIKYVNIQLVIPSEHTFLVRN